MTLQAAQAVQPSPPVSSTPWVGGQLPSPWSTPNGQPNQNSLPTGLQNALPNSLANPSPNPSSNAFTQSLEQARATVGSGSSHGLAVNPANSVTGTPADNTIAKKFGMSSIENMGIRLSQADANVYKGMENLHNIDVTAPNFQAEMLSMGLMATKASISSTVAMKFSSKVNENINTLLKTG